MLVNWNKDADAALEQIRESLRTLNDARYGRTDHFDTGALEASLVTGITAIRRLRLRRLWPALASRRPITSAANLRA